MATTTQSYDANGTQTQFTIPFEYISKADVDVYVDTVFQLQQNTTSTADPTHPQVISGDIAQGTALINYTFANDTTIEFNTAPTSGAFIFIERTTDDTSVVTFTPGSTIRAAELNLALEQVRFIAQEGTNTAQQGAIPSKDNEDSIDAQGKRIENVADANSDDDAVNRGQLAGVITQDLLEGEAIDLTASTGGTNSGDQVTISVEDSSKTNKGAVAINEGEGINVAYTSGFAVVSAEDSSKTNKGVVSINEGEGINVVYSSGDAVISGEDSSKTNKGVVSINEGHAIGVTYTSGDAVIDADKSTASQQGVIQLSSTTPITITRPTDGEVVLSIEDDSIDLSQIKDSDIRDLAEQNASPNAVGNDDEIGTTAANDKRYDVIYQNGTPTGTDWTTGKLWYDHVNDQTLSVWNGSNWLGISSGGTFVSQPTVIWVDSLNGDDANDGHRIIDAMKTIKAAVASADDGDIVLVAPGIYRETLPIDITVNNLSIVGQSLRSCFIHPTPATEENTMFRVNSGTLISNFSFAGLKASGTRGGNSIDTDSTYGLPTNQGWVAEFYPSAVIYKSPYIQNCTNFADSGIYNHTESEYNANNSLGGFFDPNNVNQGGFGGDLTSGPTGGGILINGAAVASNSPLRSMVVDAFTQITLDGPGLLCCNNGYGQLVSFFGTFCHYHAKALSGGQLNLSNCTTDYGRYGLIADGKSTTANFTASVTAAASAGDTTFTIGAPTAGTGWYGSATRPQDNMSVTIGSNTYPVSSAVANGSGWDVTIENPDPNANATNLGLAAALSIGDTASFFNRSYISTGGHTFEYVGAGTDYTAAPENGGVPIEANQVKNLNGGKVFQSSTDHNGKFKIGDTFTVNQRTGQVDISLDAYRPEVVNDLSPQLGADLDVNGFDIVSASNGNIDITPNGTGEVVLSTASVSDLTDGRVVLAGTSGSLEDNSNLTFDGSTLTTTGLTASGTASLSGITYPTADGNQNQVIITDGSGTLSFESVANLTGSGLQNVVDDTTPQLGGDLDVNGNAITSASNADVVIDPNGTGLLEVNSSILAGANSNQGQVALPNHIDTDVDSYFQVNTQGNINASISLTNCRSNSNGDPCVLFGKSGGDISTPTLLASTQKFGHLVFSGYDGSDYLRGAQIDVEVDGTPAAGSMPGRIVFSTTASSASTPSERLRISSSGNVGIGESSPEYKLHITNSTAEAITAKLANGADTNFELAAANGPTTNTSGTEVSRFGINYNGTGWNSYLQFIRGGGATTGEIAVVTSQSEALRIDDNGNVGIGTTTPAAKLEISEPNGSSTPAKMRFANAGDRAVTVGFDDHDAGPNFSVANGDATTKFVSIDSSGKVGVGTSDPYESLSVRGTGDQINLDLNSTTTDDYSAITWNTSDSDLGANQGCAIRGVRKGSSAEGELQFWTRDNTSTMSNRMRIDEGGNLYMDGTTNSKTQLTSAGYAEFNRTDDTNFGLVRLNVSQAAMHISDGTNVNVIADYNGDIRTESGIVFQGNTPGATTRLDDYEEGTWTPTLGALSGSFNRNYSTQSGTYTKIGNRVIASGRIRLSSKSGTGVSLFVLSLPFNPTVNYDSGVVGDAINFGNILPTSLLSNTSSNGFQLRAVDATQGSDNINVSHLTSTSEFEFTISYRVA